jgi:AraC-like DNA-binding protein
MITRRRLSTIGPISIVLQEAATPREALGILLRYQSLLSPFLLLRTEDHDGLTIIQVEILFDLPGPIPHGYASVLGIIYHVLSDLLGVSWKPNRVCFRHRPPADTRGFRAFFHCPVEFNAEFYGLVCHSTDLETPIAGADPGRASFARKRLDGALVGQDLSTTAVVRRVITALITTGRSTTDQVARLLGLDRRTIHRRLAREGQTFSTVLQSVRHQLALDQVMGSNRSVGEIASLLGFAAPNAFSTWFKSTFGASVTEMRRRG